MVKRFVQSMVLFGGMMVMLAGCGAVTFQTEDGQTGTAADGVQEESSGQNREVKKLTADEAWQRMQSGAPVVIVDVRTQEEYEAGHIEGALLIPNEEIGAAKPELLPVMDAEIMIYCRSGNRSAQAAAKLVQQGYTNVSDFGGINDWTYGTAEGNWEDKANTLALFRGSDINGQAVDEHIFEDKTLTMVNVWATYCSPCLKEMPELGELSNEYEDRNVQIVGAVIDAFDADSAVIQAVVEQARSLAVKTGAEYRHLLLSPELLSGSVGAIYAVPTTFFVDGAGQVVGDTYEGARSKADWSKIIDSILADMQ